MMPRRRRRNNVASADSVYFDRMLLNYIKTIVRSDLFERDMADVCDLAEKAIGEEIGAELREPFPVPDDSKGRDARNSEISAEIAANNAIREVGKKHACRVLRITLGKLIDARLKQIPEGCDSKERRINKISKIFGLSKVEKDILTFRCIANTPLGRECFQAQLGDYSDFEKMVISGHKILQCSRLQVQKALAPSGKLFQLTLFEKDSGSGFEPSEWLRLYIAGLLRDNLALEFCTKYKGDCLPLEFHHADNSSKDLMAELLARKKGAVNILFYGEPGSGKSELAKSLAAKTGKSLYILNNDKDETDYGESSINTLKGGLVTVSKLISPESAILLVDEADNLLNTGHSFFGPDKANSKAWLNNFLDSSRNKIIWITNRSSQIEPSVLRRFTFSMKFKRMSNETKIAVFNNSLKKKRLDGFFTEQEIGDICRQYRINAGGIVDMLKTLKVRRNQDKQAVMAKLHLILKNHETAIHRGEPVKAKMKEVTSYSIDSLNLSEKPQALIDSIRNYLEVQAGAQKSVKSMNLLFYGNPGTGKTEFAKYLSMALDREIRLKRASDLISKYVGESEKLIAEAFEEAAHDDAILFLDEADTFFYPRGMAQHSWEKSQTNELLTQMENYNGILICATNMKDGLDDAALRRFKYKVEFKALTGEGVVAMYQAMLAPLAAEPLTPCETTVLDGIAGLTHGDFFVVSEKYSLLKDKATHADLIASLRQELAHKKKTPRIGFRIAG